MRRFLDNNSVATVAGAKPRRQLEIRTLPKDQLDAARKKSSTPRKQVQALALAETRRGRSDAAPRKQVQALALACARACLECGAFYRRTASRSPGSTWTSVSMFALHVPCSVSAGRAGQYTLNVVP